MYDVAWVTRLGEFGPLGDFFLWALFLKITEGVLILTAWDIIFCDFFSKLFWLPR
jgi:hypothetical protein